MRDMQRFEFITDEKQLAEAIAAGSRSLLTPKDKLVSNTTTLIVTLLSGLGGLSIAVVLANWASDGLGWAGVAGLLIGGGIYLFNLTHQYAAIVRGVTHSPLNLAPQAIAFDNAGLTYEAGPAVWKTPWAMVDTVLDTKATITFVVGGITFALPKPLVGDADAVAALLADLRKRLGNAGPRDA